MTPGNESGGGAEKDKHSAENDKNSAENDEIKVPKKSAETGGNPFLSSPVLHEKILKEAKKLSLQTDIHVMKADKGRNTLIWSVEDYDREGNRQHSEKFIKNYLKMNSPLNYNPSNKCFVPFLKIY
jgi:hypothetical protein